MPLTVTGIGLITAVGHDVATSCASMRAGITRPKAIEHYYVMDENSHKEEALIGYPIAGITDGFSNVGRWLAMAKYALKDLIIYSNLPDTEDALFWTRTAIIFITPVLNAARFDLADMVNADNVKDVYIAPCIRQLKLPIALQNSFIVSEDNPGTMSACGLTHDLLNTGSNIDRVILLAADTNIDPHSLWWLTARGQLKLKDKPTGLIPGEAAAAVLLESEKSIRQRNAKGLAQIRSYCKKFENNYFYNDNEDNKNTGKALNESIVETLLSAQLNEPFAGYLCPDINGENWRAVEFSYARIKTHRDLLAAECPDIIIPLSLGDVGAITALCGLCMIIEGHRRQYSKYNAALITASSPYGPVGSMLAYPI